MAVKSILWVFLIAGLVLPELARAQERPTVIRAATLLDGTGGVMHNVSIVVQGTRITSIDSNARSVTYDLKGLTVTTCKASAHPEIETFGMLLLAEQFQTHGCSHHCGPSMKPLGLPNKSERSCARSWPSG